MEEERKIKIKVEDLTLIFKKAGGSCLLKERCFKRRDLKKNV
jgi:hypothetical protein